MEVSMLGVGGEVIKKFDVKVDTKKYMVDELYKKSEEIINKVRVEYYMQDGELSNEEITNIIDEVMGD